MSPSIFSYSTNSPSNKLSLLSSPLSLSFFLSKQELTKQMGKIIYKDTKGVEDFQPFHIVSVIRTQSIPMDKSCYLPDCSPQQAVKEIQGRRETMTTLLYPFCRNGTEHPGPLQWRGRRPSPPSTSSFASELSSSPSPLQ